MLNTDEQLKTIMDRAKVIKKKHDVKVTIAVEAVSSALCLIVLAAVTVLLPGFDAGSTAATQVRYGSLILRSSYIGYVVIGALAFILGILITLLCTQVRKLKLAEELKED
ncbi:MAG: hypothetical protein K5796_04645 [Lachnospiraceae bacterium]|nr:hypothetical protein [Lachnospiraceae bacterium]